MELEFSLGMESDEPFLNIEEPSTNNYEKLTEASLIPKVGHFLGLDISETSSGITFYENGAKLQANIKLETKESEDFFEVKLRRELKTHLTTLVEGKDFDLIIIEDAYQGVNADTTRKLYAINTAIDELILDGVCTCKTFLRTPNKTWKSWLFKIDTEGLYKGLTDKLRIQKCLELLGITDSGEGFQDRLDSCGMLVGYFLEGKKSGVKKKSPVKISTSDIVFDFQECEDFLSENARRSLNDEDLEIIRVDIGAKHWNMQIVKDYLTENPNVVFITENTTKLGNFAKAIGVTSTIEGYLAFWLSKSARKRINKTRG